MNTFRTLVVSLLVLTRLDYDNSVLACLPVYPGPSATVGAERGCETDVSSPPIRPHHRRDFLPIPVLRQLQSLAGRGAAKSYRSL